MHDPVVVVPGTVYCLCCTSVFLQVFAQLDANSDGVLSWDEVNKANLFTIMMQFPHIVPGMTPKDIEEIKESLGLEEEEEDAGEEGTEEAEGAEGEEAEGKEARKEEL